MSLWSRIAKLVNAAGREMLAIVDELGELVKVIHIRRVERQLIITVSAPELGHTFSALLLAGGVGGIVYSAAPVFMTTTATSAPVATVQNTPQEPTGLDRSVPTHLEIPDIKISTDLITLNKNADGTLQTPDAYDIAGWYTLGPSPGQVGPAVIVGHVDNYLGPAVFFRLHELGPGQVIYVERQDGKKVTFTVDSVELFDQQNFPTQAVYGNIDHPGLRLITCGGTYNVLTGRYSHNTVVYASARA